MSQNIPFPFNLGGGVQSGSVQLSQHPSGPQSSQQSVQPLPTGQIQQPAHQAAVQQNAQLPGVDLAALSALQGVSMEQLTLIARLFQSGALPLPQAVGVGGPSSTVSSATLPIPSSTSNLPSQSNATASIPPGDVDMDKEEGELEEGEEPDIAMEREFLRPPPTGPRKRSISPRGGHQQALPTTSPFMQKTCTTRQESNDRRSSGQTRHGNAKQNFGRAEASRDFLTVMYNAGFTFDQISKEVPSSKSLRRMFKQLNFPAETVKAHAPTTNGAPESSQLGQSAETRQVPAKHVTAAKSTALTDRTDYLARLKALQSKKSELSTSQPSPKVAQPVASLVADTAQPKPAAPVAAPSPGSKTTPIDKNELLKKKIEALKAIQAAKAKLAQPVGNTPTVPNPPAIPAKPEPPAPRMTARPASASFPHLGAESNGTATQIRRSSQFAPPPAPAPATLMNSHASQMSPSAVQSAVPVVAPAPSRSFSSLPGLFMFGAPNQPLALHNGITQSQPPTTIPSMSNAMAASSNTDAASVAESPAPLISRKRPLASDFDLDSHTESMPDVKRPLFGQSRSNSESEKLVIEVSEDDGEDDMDLDEPTIQPELRTPVQATPLSSIGPLRDFPPKPTFSAQVSTPGTPPVITPGSAAQYAKTMADIEEIKRKIAEKEAAKLNVRNNKLVKDAMTPTSGISTPASQIVPASSENSLQQAVVQNTSSNASPRAATLNRQQEKEIWRRKILELEQERLQRAGASAEPVSLGALHNPDRTTAGSVPTSTVAPVKIPSSGVAEPNSGTCSEAGHVDNVANQTIAAARAAEDDDGKVGSQATTASASNRAEAILQTSLAEAPMRSLDNGRSSASTPTAFVELARAYVAEHGMSVPTDEDDKEGEINEESFEDDSLENDDEDHPEDQDGDMEDLANTDRGVAQPLPHAAFDAKYVPTPDSESDDSDDTSSASSDESEDYEPNPAAAVVSSSGPDGDEHNPDAVIPPTSEGRPDLALVGSSHSKIDHDQSQVVHPKDVMDDELAPELQAPVVEAPVVDDEEIITKTYYTPYQSALSRYKDYRYHTDYLDTVSGGFKSLTYSNNIDPMKPLCRTEAQGGRCRDSKCTDQHFETMALSDNDLLKFLGTHNTPVKTPAEEKKWREGLGAVVRQLRVTNLGKDVSAIAARIAEFRREFIGDPSRVLHLKES